MGDKSKMRNYLKDYATGRFTKDIEGELDAGVKTAQEKGEDYSAKVHVPSSADTIKAAQDMIDRDKAFLDSDQESQEWDAASKTFKTVKQTGYSQRYGKPHPTKGY